MPLYQLRERSFHAGSIREAGEVVSLREDERPGPHMRLYQNVSGNTFEGRATDQAITAAGTSVGGVAGVMMAADVAAAFVQHDVKREPEATSTRPDIVLPETPRVPASSRLPRNAGYVFLDLETNGLSDPRIASAALIFADCDLKTEFEVDELVRPDGWVMDPRAQAVNGLDMARLEAEGVDLGQVLAYADAAIRLGRVLVCHNAEFDLRCLRAEMKRRKRISGVMPWPFVCTMVQSRAAIGIGKLGLAHERLTGAALEGAHQAMADARACQRVFEALVDKGMDVAAATQRGFEP